MRDSDSYDGTSFGLLKFEKDWKDAAFGNSFSDASAGGPYDVGA